MDAMELYGDAARARLTPEPPRLIYAFGLRRCEIAMLDHAIRAFASLIGLSVNASPRWAEPRRRKPDHLRGLRLNRH